MASVPVIHRLEESVVNRIAAGEVIQRPSSALKELLENSLDAGSTQINVLVKEGGNKLLHIQDNGHGIRKADLPILCHRHTTSKLKEYDDLETIGTLGFRGEALCSISFVSHMTVTTMTADEPHGWRVTYKDSEMEPPGAKPVAAVPGTTITVEDLFYNVPTRKKALKSASEEYGRILDTTSRYAVFKSGLAFSCKRQGEARTDLTTLMGASRLDNIRAVYGPAVAKELLPFELSQGPEPGPSLGPDDDTAFRVQGYISGVNYNSKKTTFILFINGRLVESAPLKRALESLYSTVLPGSKAGAGGGGGSKPWVFLDVQLPPRHVEVNLHPTKREVGFLHQDEVIEAIRCGVEQRLLAANTTRTFTQMQLPFAPIISEAAKERKLERGSSGSQQGTQPYRPEKLVRTDPASQSLDAYLSNPYKAAAVSGSVARRRGNGAAAMSMGSGSLDLTLPEPDGLLDMDTYPGQQQQQQQLPGSFSEEQRPGRGDSGVILSELSSVRELLEEVEAAAHQGLGEILRGHTFVGMADETWGLLQHQTKLYLVDVSCLTRDLFYQQVLRRFEHHRRLMLDPPVPIHELVLLALEVEEAAGEWQPSQLSASGTGGSKQEVADLVVELLREKAPLLSECLSMDVDTALGCVASLPLLLEGHRPDPARLPSLMLALARDVEWEEEKECFRGLAKALADFYAVRPLLLPAEDRMPCETLQQQQQQQQSNGSASQGSHMAADNPGGTSCILGVVPEQQEGRQLQDVAMNNGSPAQLHEGGAAGPSRQQQEQQEEQQQQQLLSKGSQQQGGQQGLNVVTAEQPDDLSAMEIEGEAGGWGTGPAAGEMETMEAAEEVDGGEAAYRTVDPGSGAAAGPAGEAGAAAAPGGDAAASVRSNKESRDREWMIKHVIFPAMRTHLRPGRQRATDGSCVQVASLERLYRIFERC